MPRIFQRIAFSLMIGLIAAPVQAEPAESTTCNKYGTAIEWVKESAELTKRAKEQSKLVFLMHISGNFARADFT